MPPRASHLPNYFERSALQKLLALGELPSVRPASDTTLKRMLTKGWIEQTNSGQFYLITPAGEAVFKVKLPIHHERKH